MVRRSAICSASAACSEKPPAPCRWCWGRVEAAADVAEHLLARYWSPQPQLALGEALRSRATAALDISDGLLADCGHIAKASGVALQIERDRVPLSEPLRRFAGDAEALRCALAGGDDYVLAFTLPPAELATLQDAQWPVHVIGCVVAGQGVQLVDAAGNELPVSARGYNHFHA